MVYYISRIMIALTGKNHTFFNEKSLKMKKAVVVILLLFPSILLLKAQKSEVIEVREHLKDVTQNAFETFIYNLEPEIVEKEFRLLMKKYLAKKVSSNKEFIYGEGVLIQVINLNIMNVYAKSVNLSGGTKLIVFFELAENVFLSCEQNPQECANVRKFIYDFVIRLRKEKVGNELAESRERLIKLERELENTKREQQNMQRSIENYKESIVKTENELSQNKLTQERLINEVSSQKIVISKITEKQNMIE